MLFIVTWWKQINTQAHKVVCVYYTMCLLAWFKLLAGSKLLGSSRMFVKVETMRIMVGTPSYLVVETMRIMVGTSTYLSIIRLISGCNHQAIYQPLIDVIITRVLPLLTKTD